MARQVERGAANIEINLEGGTVTVMNESREVLYHAVVKAGYWAQLWRAIKRFKIKAKDAKY